MVVDIKTSKLTCNTQGQNCNGCVKGFMNHLNMVVGPFAPLPQPEGLCPEPVMLDLALNPTQGKDGMALARRDKEDRPGDTVGDPLAGEGPEECGLGPVPEDLNRHVPVLGVHQGQADLLVHLRGGLTESLREEDLAVEGQGRGSKANGLGRSPRLLAPGGANHPAGVSAAF